MTSDKGYYRYQQQACRIIKSTDERTSKIQNGYSTVKTVLYYAFIMAGLLYTLYIHSLMVY